MRRAVAALTLLLGGFPPAAQAARPAPLHTPAPSYPSWAIGSGIATEVELRVRIDREGRVRRVEVVPYSVRHDFMTRDLRASFDSAAVRAVRAWTFRPATPRGRASSAWWTLRVPFSDPEDAKTSGDSASWTPDTASWSTSSAPVEHPAPEWPAPVPYGCRGQVTVRILVGPDGRAWAANVARSALSCQDPSLRAAVDEAVVRAARRWRYRPGDHEGEPVLVDFRVPAPRLDAPVVVGCVRDSVTGKLRPEVGVFGPGGHGFGQSDESGWFVLRGAATRSPRLRAQDAGCTGGFRAVRVWKHPGDEITLYTRGACGGGAR